MVIEHEDDVFGYPDVSSELYAEGLLRGRQFLDPLIRPSETA